MSVKEISVNPSDHDKIMDDWGRRRSFAENMNALIQDVLHKADAKDPCTQMADAGPRRPPQTQTGIHSEATRFEGSKATEFVVDGASHSVNHWKDVDEILIREASKRAATSADILKRFGIIVVSGHRKKKGYRYIEELHLSFQIKSPPLIMRHVAKFALFYDLPCEVHLTKPEDGHRTSQIVRVP